MIAILPVALTEVSRALDLLLWVKELGGCRRHSLVILAANPVQQPDITVLVDAARDSFHTVEAIRQRDAVETGWPKNANAMFRCAAEYVAGRNGAMPWLWVEVDAIPICSGWLDMIEDEHRRVGKPFTGAIYMQPMRHINGVAVYPPNLYNLNPWMAHATDRPFDLTRPEIALRLCNATNLIVRSLANPAKNFPHTFPDKASLGQVPIGCVLFHGVKNGSLIARLRESRNPITSSYQELTRNPSSLTHSSKLLHKRLSAMMGTKLKLPGITVWAASWSMDKEMQERTIRVLNYCDKILKVERMVFFSHMPVPKGDHPFEVISIPQLDWQKWSIFVNREVPKYIHSEFALSVHEDGFVIDRDCWDPEFLNWDLTGAPWKLDKVVGNGGFCLTSKKLMKLTMNMPSTPEEFTTASDMYVCRNRAEYLKKKGIKFAPADLALRFSTEEYGQQWPSFAFHGRKLSPEKYSRGWKLIEASEAK